MHKTAATYRSLIGYEQGARRIHVHVTELDPCGDGWGSQHSHAAEEALYMLEGRAEFTFAGATHHVGPGEAVFFPSGVMHAEARFLSETARYLVIRTVEPEDEPCCCAKDRPMRAPGAAAEAG